MPLTSSPHPASHALVIGEALVDIVVSADGVRRVHPGGSPMNVAVGLARLDIPTTLATTIGTDAAGTQIAHHLDEAGVALAPGSTSSRPTSTAVATLDDSGAAHYDFNLNRELPVPDVRGAALVHTGSIGALVEPGATAVRTAFADAAPSTLLSFDPNIRPDVMGSPEDVRPRVEFLARSAHVVKMSDEDAAWLYPDSLEAEIAGRYAAMGVALVVITRGPRGCYLRAGDHDLSLTPPPATVVDTIGAGDAFMSGMLYALLDSALTPQIYRATLDTRALHTVGRVALASAAITVSRAGANPPTLTELATALQESGA